MEQTEKRKMSDSFFFFHLISRGPSRGKKKSIKISFTQLPPPPLHSGRSVSNSPCFFFFLNNDQVVFDWRHGSPWLPRGRATPAAKTAKGPTDFSELVVALRQHLSVTVQFLPIESKT